MKKTVYTTPHMRVVKITPRHLICTSNFSTLSNNAELEYAGAADEDVDIR